MSETPEMSIYEKKFAKSEDTDAILVVEGKKLHVNKGLLSIHSPYFKTMFNSNFKEKSMEEIPIEDVKFEDFSTLLSLVHPEPIKLTSRLTAAKLLKIADRFMLSAAKNYLELYLITFSTSSDRYMNLQLADRYQLDSLLDSSIKYFEKYDKPSLLESSVFNNLSESTKFKLVIHMFHM